MTYSAEDRDAIRTMLRRAAILAVDDTGTQQLLDLFGLKADKPRKVVKVEDFGFASNPPAGGEGLIVCPGGRSDRAMFLGGAHKDFRPKNLPVGGVTIYDAFGQAISFVEHNIRVVGAQTITIQAPVIVLDGAVQITGNVTGAGGGTITLAASINQIAGNIATVGNVTASGIPLAGHKHDGVQTGGGTTGPAHG